MSVNLQYGEQAMRMENNENGPIPSQQSPRMEHGEWIAMNTVPAASSVGRTTELWNTDTSGLLRTYNAPLVDASQKKDWYDTFIGLRAVVFWLCVMVMVASMILCGFGQVQHTGHAKGGYTLNVCNIMYSSGKNFTADAYEESCVEFLSDTENLPVAQRLSGESIGGYNVVFKIMPVVNSIVWIAALLLGMIAGTQLAGIMRVVVEPGTESREKQATVPLGIKAAVIEYCEHTFLPIHAPYLLFVCLYWMGLKPGLCCRIILCLIVSQWLFWGTVLLGSNWFDKVNMGSIEGAKLPNGVTEILFCAWYRSNSYYIVVGLQLFWGVVSYYVSTALYGVVGGQMELAIWLTAMIRGSSGELRNQLSGLCDYGNFTYRVRGMVNDIVIGIDDVSSTQMVGHLSYILKDVKVNDYEEQARVARLSVPGRLYMGNEPCGERLPLPEMTEMLPVIEAGDKEKPKSMPDYKPSETVASEMISRVRAAEATIEQETREKSEQTSEYSNVEGHVKPRATFEYDAFV